MPQLDTSTWFMMISTMVMSLFIVMQLKISSHHYYPNPQPKLVNTMKNTTPWEKKWTKIYLPLL